MVSAVASAALAALEAAADVEHLLATRLQATTNSAR
jgi:hypothetical protein